MHALGSAPLDALAPVSPASSSTLSASPVPLGLMDRRTPPRFPASLAGNQGGDGGAVIPSDFSPEESPPPYSFDTPLDHQRVSYTYGRGHPPNFE